jgi:L-rhamnose mutarotase
MKNLSWILSPFLFLFTSCSTGENAFPAEETVARYGSVILVKAEKLEEYKALHADPWPEVNKMLKEVHIRNYSIYYRDGYLFSYFEYTGSDFEADMAKMAADSITREWWKLTDPCQLPVETAAEGEWWAPMEELYHLD